MSRIVRWLDGWLYPEYSRNWDDCIFRERVLEHLGRSVSLLDLGAGAGIVEQMNFKGMAARVCGVDLDPRVVTNPLLDEGRVADAGQIPYADETFDVVLSDNVIEHLSNPRQVLLEVNRVLRPGGVLLFKTPNRRHYMPTIARLTPHRFHQFVNRLRGRPEVDTFPTLYRANTLLAIRKLAAQSGFAVERVDLIEGRPEYMRVAWPMYLLGALYERAVNSFEFLAMFRILIVAQLRKQDVEVG